MNSITHDQKWAIFQEVVKARRSIRRFKTDPVPPEKIAAMLEAAILAPSDANLQPWDFVVVSSETVRLKLVDLLQQVHSKLFSEVLIKPLTSKETEEMTGKLITGVRAAPVFIVACLHRKQARFQESYDVGEFWDILSIGAAVENMLLAATAQGLGAVWMGSPRLNEDALKALLGIPAEVRVVGVFPVGYPADLPDPRPRDPYESVVHQDKW